MTVKIEHKWVNVDDLRESGFNPVRRTRIKPNDDLVISMRDKGYLECCPILLAKDGRVGDGHRRLAAARLLGLEKVYVLQTHLTAEELYELNGPTKAQTTADWDEVTDKADVKPTATVGKYHELLEELCGPHAKAYLVEHGKSSYIVKTLKRLLKYLGVKKDQSIAFDVLCWMVDLNQQRPSIDAMGDNVAPAILLRAVKERKPLRRGNWLV